MMGFGSTLAHTHNTGLITMAVTATATTITRTNIDGSGGTGTIIVIITSETMIATTTGIDLLGFRTINWLSAT